VLSRRGVKLAAECLSTQEFTLTLLFCSVGCFFSISFVISSMWFWQLHVQLQIFYLLPCYGLEKDNVKNFIYEEGEKMS
jgi:hypothetical protein